MARWHGFVLVLGIATVGCNREPIRVYQVPKTQSASQSAAAEPRSESAFITQPARLLSWETPSEWTELPPSAMRVGSFRISGAEGQQAEVSVIPLGGSGGDDLSNVNRWRAQVGQPPITAAELQQQAEQLEVAGLPALLYEVGNEQTRIVAVIVHRGGTTWFFKLAGSAELVSRQKPVFLRFLRSVQFASEPTDSSDALQSTAQPHEPVAFVRLTRGQVTSVCAHPELGAENRKALAKGAMLRCYSGCFA